MIKGYNNILRLSLLLIVLCSIASCDTGSLDFLDTPLTDNNDGVVEEDGRMVVVLPVSSSSSTRTTIDPDDLSSVKWSVGDQVALWADGLSSTDGNLTGEMFQLSSYSGTFDNADFSGSIYPMSDDQTYNYYGFYPYTTSASGKVVSYTLPSTQSGEYDGDLDFRVAYETTGDALSSDTYGAEFSLAFESITHALKITIPEGYNFFGHSVNRLMITMPANVVGSCSLDISDSSATPSFSNGGSVITLDFGDDTIDEGDAVWAFINPTSGVTGDIKIRGISSDNDWSYEYEIPVSDHTFGAGRITPINTEIGEEMPSTTIMVNISENNLGENLTNINVTAPEGAIFNESGTNTATISGTTSFKLSYITDLYGDKFKGASLTLELESDQALIPSTAISLSSITEDGVNSFNRTVPYILYEDFSSITTFNSNANAGVGGTDINTGDKDVINLSDKGLTGSWTATRVGAEAGKAIRICCRYESGASITTKNDGRVDSPKFAYLKDGATVTVSYKYKGGRYSMYKEWVDGYWATTSSWPYKKWVSGGYEWMNGGSGNTVYSYGSTTTAVSDPDLWDDITGANSGDGFLGSEAIENVSASDVTLPNTAGSNSSSSQTYDSISYSNSYTITGATSSTRASWKVSTTCSDEVFVGNNGNFWLYLDDVVVQVVPKS